MAENIYEFRFQRGSSARWTELNPTLGPGEPGVEIDTGLFKMGDGNTPWNDLHYYLTEPYILGMIEVELAETGGLSSDPRVGDLEDLTTTAKDLIVSAINEVKSSVDSITDDFSVTFGRAGNLTVFTGPRLYFPDDAQLLDATFSLTTAPTGAPAVFEVLKNGVGSFSSDPTISESEFLSSTGTLVGATTFAARTDYLQVQCSQAGSTVPGSDLAVVLKMRLV